MGFQTGLDAQGRRTWVGKKDAMLNGPLRTTARLPRRVVVEFEPAEFERLDRACGGIPDADLLRVIALRVVKGEHEQR